MPNEKETEGVKPIQLDKEKPNFFRFRKVADGMLITNDFGGHAMLTDEEFRLFAEGKIDTHHPKYRELAQAGFLKDDLSLDMAINLYRSRNSSIFYGPSLHIIVVTLRCNYRCVYCQASSRPEDADGYDMDIETAKRTVDFIFSTPNKRIDIEFQGGEPLINWPVVKFITEYSKKKAEDTGKTVFLSLVSNLVFMDEEKLKFFYDNTVGLCTSLDGPEELHNINRPCPGDNSYKQTTKWIDRIKEEEKKKNEDGSQVFLLSALLTVSRHSLPKYKEIIDEYVKHGFIGIHLRALSDLGDAKGAMSRIGYSTDEFIEFWKNSLDYILELNKSGIELMERGSEVILKKILKAMDPGFVDLKSPCGAVIGQMLYNYDGKIYTCDEGRMCPGDVFAIGRIGADNHKENYSGIVSGGKTKAMMISSTLDNTPCDYCVYKPYCGICPVLNYAIYGNLNPQMPESGWCKRHKAMFDYLFEKMQDKENLEIFKKWI